MLTQRLFPNFPFLTEPKDPLLLCSVFRESGSHPPLTHFPDHSPRVSELPGVDRPGEDLGGGGENTVFGTPLTWAGKHMALGAVGGLKLQLTPQKAKQRDQQRSHSVKPT